MNIGKLKTAIRVPWTSMPSTEIPHLGANLSYPGRHRTREVSEVQSIQSGEAQSMFARLFALHPERHSSAIGQL